MPVDLPNAIETAIQHLQDGALQAASDLLVQALSDYRRQLETIGIGAPALPKGKTELLLDFLKLTAAHFGNPPDLEYILSEFARPE